MKSMSNNLLTHIHFLEYYPVQLVMARQTQQTDDCTTPGVGWADTTEFYSPLYLLCPPKVISKILTI